MSTENVSLARQLSCKLAPRWVGPFPVSSVVSSVVYCVEFPAEYGRMHLVFYFSYLCLYVGPVPPELRVPLLLDDITTRKYEVEIILDSRLGWSGTEYLIKQAGYLEFKSMIESAKYLSNAHDVLDSSLVLHQYPSHQIQ